jgi:hypothetical protein
VLFTDPSDSADELPTGFFFFALPSATVNRLIRRAWYLCRPDIRPRPRIR